MRVIFLHYQVVLILLDYYILIVKFDFFRLTFQLSQAYGFATPGPGQTAQSFGYASLPPAANVRTFDPVMSSGDIPKF